MSRLGEFFVILTREPQPKDTTFNPDALVALDPGVRAFQTTYNPNGVVTEIGSGDMKGIVDKFHCYSRLQSEATKCRARKRYRLRKAMARIMRYIKNAVDDSHNKSIKWLLDNHSVILIPAFGTHKMVERKGKLARATRRALLTWSHFRFRLKLLSKANEYPGRKVFVVDESWTSKTCTCCGNIVVQNKKRVRCRACGYESDRDFAGARNICIKFLQERLNAVVGTGPFDSSWL